MSNEVLEKGEPSRISYAHCSYCTSYSFSALWRCWLQLSPCTDWCGGTSAAITRVLRHEHAQAATESAEVIRRTGENVMLTASGTRHFAEAEN